jgi:acetyl/propionyl-CoA carboxylase alpha subunit
MENHKNSKEYKEAKDQNESKNKLSADIQAELDRLLRLSPTEIKHEEMMFVLEHMDMGSLLKAAAERQNKQFIESVKPNDEQNN